VLTESTSDVLIACPLCGGETARVFERHGYWLRDCRTCEHRFAEIGAADPRTHAASVYRDEYFFGGGAGYPDYLAEGAMLRTHGRSYGRLLARHHPLGDLLDVGAAAGFILAGLIDEGWHGEGVEPNATMAGYARSTLGLRIIAPIIEQVTDAERFDAVTMIQVLAHFVDPMAAMRSAAHATKRHGLLLVESWLRDSLTARLFGKSWHEYSPPSVLHWYTAESIAHMAGLCGYRLVARGRPRKHIAGSHAKSALAQALGGGAVSKLLAPIANIVPDRALLPYPAEDLTWLLFRKQ